MIKKSMVTSTKTIDGKREVDKKIFATFVNPHDPVDTPKISFYIDNYHRLAHDDNYWKVIEPANEFLKTLTEDEYNTLGRMLTRVSRLIPKILNRHALLRDVKLISEYIAVWFSDDILQRIHDFVMSDGSIHIPTRDDVSDEFSSAINPVEYCQICVLAIIVKILFPIFGHLMHRIDEREIGATIKYISASCLMHGLLSKKLYLANANIRSAIDIGVIAALNRDDVMVNSMTAMTGVDRENYFSRLIVVNLVNTDLRQEGGDILRYISVTVKRAVMTTAQSRNCENIGYRVPCYKEILEKQRAEKEIGIIS